MSVCSEIWGEWNRISGDERLAFIEHAEMLIERGYIQPDSENPPDVMEVALKCFEASRKAKKLP